jgi:ribosomal protein L21
VKYLLEKLQKKMEITEVFSVDGEEVVVSEEIVQAAKIATESLRMKKNTETLWTGLKLRKSHTSVPKKNIQQLIF